MRKINIIEEIRVLIRETEKDNIYFSDKEIRFYYEKNNKDLYKTVYELLIIKAEDDNIKISSSIEIPSTKEYFLRLARKYRQNKSGVLKC